MCASPLQGGAPSRASDAGTPARTQGVLLIAPASPRRHIRDGNPSEPCQGCAVAAQATALQRALPKGWVVFHAVHPGRPAVADALRSMRAAGVGRVVAIPMRPQFSSAATGAALAELYCALGSAEFADLHTEVRAWWHDDAAYVDAHARHIHAFALERSLTPLNSILLFPTDETPADPRDAARLNDAAQLLLKRLGWPDDRAAVVPAQSDAAAAIRAAADAHGADDRTNLLVCPLTRMAGCPSLDVEKRGGEDARFHVCPPPGSSEDFIRAIALLVRRGRQPAQRPEPPLIAPHDTRSIVSANVDDLIMAGVCVDCTLGRVGGPGLRSCPPEALRRYKRPHLETLALLRNMGDIGLFRECWIWNTCSRYEFYAWVRPGSSDEERRAALRRAAHEVLGPDAASHANLLIGRDAWHHALRTAAGLNSALVGDAEVVDQLQASRCAAGYAGTAGERTDAFIHDIASSVDDLRAASSWGRYAHRYCDVALSRLAPRLGASIAQKRCVVIGGSTTSCSILETLGQRFGVPRSNLSIIYRGFRKGALIRRLREAVGEDRTTIVAEYSDPAILNAIAQADLVFFAIDQRFSIVSADAIAAARDLSARPLTAVDFNTFNSVAAPDPVPGLTLIESAEIDRAVDEFNQEVLRDPRLGPAVGEAERWIAAHVRPQSEPQPPRRRPPFVPLRARGQEVAV